VPYVANESEHTMAETRLSVHVCKKQCQTV